MVQRAGGMEPAAGTDKTATIKALSVQIPSEHKNNPRQLLCVCVWTQKKRHCECHRADSPMCPLCGEEPENEKGTTCQRKTVIRERPIPNMDVIACCGRRAPLGVESKAMHADLRAKFAVVLRLKTSRRLQSTGFFFHQRLDLNLLRRFSHYSFGMVLDAHLLVHGDDFISLGHGTAHGEVARVLRQSVHNQVEIKY